jgi:hypothetical protein
VRYNKRGLTCGHAPTMRPLRRGEVLGPAVVGFWDADGGQLVVGGREAEDLYKLMRAHCAICATRRDRREDAAGESAGDRPPDTAPFAAVESPPVAESVAPRRGWVYSRRVGT